MVASELPIDATCARRIVLHLQGLTANPNRRLAGDDLLHIIHRLGFVQVDAINWVERAHHMILFARNQTYRPRQLKALLERDRRLFEGWTHDASIIPCAFYPYWKHHFDRSRQQLRHQFRQWQGEGFIDHVDDLLTLIRDNGAIRSRDLEAADKSADRDMWQWHDGKAALEYLWRTGKLCIAARDKFQKVYDLTERVLPAGLAGDGAVATVSHEQFIDWCCRSALERLGFGTAADIARFWDHLTIGEVRAWLAGPGAGHWRPVMVGATGDVPPRPMVARADIETVVASLGQAPGRIRALSPFDPVIRDRARLQRLFGFDYRIEIYVPQSRRKYGYYVFPLLEGDRLIGRIDMRAERANDRLTVKALWLEAKVRPSRGRLERLHGELVRQARLAGVAHVVDDPKSLANKLSPSPGS